METNENKYEKRSCCCNKKHRTARIIMCIVGFIAILFLFGAIVMWLWNWLMPLIFHLGVITYWQAVGLAILGRLLFGCSHHGSHHNGQHNFGTMEAQALHK